jgi:WD40 repeat protein
MSDALSKVCGVIVFIAFAGCLSKSNQGTQIAPSLTGTFSSTITVKPATHISYQTVLEKCVRVEDGPTTGLEGSLVIDEGYDNEDVVLFDLTNSEELLIGSAVNYEVSPNGSQLAYQDLDLRSLVIVDSNGSKLKSFPDYWNNLYLVSWLDNHHLLFDERRGNFGEIDYQFSLTVLNVDSGEEKEFFPEDYPNLNYIENEVNWEIESRLVVNPDFQTLVYPARLDGVPTILWNISESEEVVRIFGGDLENIPMWSPDGGRFLVSAPIKGTESGILYENITDGLPFVGGWDLFLIKSSGEIDRLTYFATSEPSYQDGYKWSPDGSKIAFFVQGVENYEPGIGELAIIDMESDEITKYCIQGASLAWSPNSQNLVVTSKLGAEDFSVYIINIEKGQAWLVSEKSQTFGWLAP